MNLKTVISLNAQSRVCEKHLIFRRIRPEDEIKTEQIIFTYARDVNGGIYAIQGFSMFYGGSLIFEGQLNSKTQKPFTGADVITVYYASLFGVFGLMIGPWFSAYGKLKPAMESYFKMALKKSGQHRTNEYLRNRKER